MVVVAYCLDLKTQLCCVSVQSVKLEWSHVTLVLKYKNSKNNQHFGLQKILTFYDLVWKSNFKFVTIVLLVDIEMWHWKDAQNNKQYLQNKIDTIFTYHLLQTFFFRIFKENFSIIFGKKYNNKIHRPVGLRYGRATDLTKAGVPESTIRKITRHAGKSKVLFRYINMTNIQALETIKNLNKLNKLF